MRCRHLVWLLSVVLAGCATTPRPMLVLDPVQQRQLLQELPRFSLNGRVRVNAGEQSVMPSVNWEQQRDVTKVRLSSLLGTGGVQLEYSPARLQLTAGRDVKLVDGDAEAELVRQIGFAPPFESLRYWILGIAAPGPVASTAFDEAGLLQQLEQQGWKISYQRYVAVESAMGAVRLPALLIASRDDLQLRLVVDRWRLGR
jgi:outer membrane lipoprotein LolB